MGSIIPETVASAVLTEILPTEDEVKKQITVIEALREALDRYAKEKGFPYHSIEPQGSTGKKQTQLRGASDIDLFVVVRRDTPALREALADLAWEVQFEHGVIISDIIRSVEQLHLMQARRFPYYQSVEREGILLWKSTSEPMPSYA